MDAPTRDSAVPVTSCKLREGDRVEVRPNDERARSSWHTATVVDVESGRCIIEYDELLSGDSLCKIRESIPLPKCFLNSFSPNLTSSSPEQSSSSLMRTASSKFSILRPLPSSTDLLPLPWRSGLFVDVHSQGVWLEVILLDDVIEKEEKARVNVFNPDKRDSQYVLVKDLRISQLWDEITGEWIIKGSCNLSEFLKGHIIKREEIMQTTNMNRADSCDVSSVQNKSFSHHGGDSFSVAGLPGGVEAVDELTEDMVNHVQARNILINGRSIADDETSFSNELSNFDLSNMEKYTGQNLPQSLFPEISRLDGVSCTFDSIRLLEETDCVNKSEALESVNFLTDDAMCESSTQLSEYKNAVQGNCPMQGSSKEPCAEEETFHFGSTGSPSLDQFDNSMCTFQQQDLQQSILLDSSRANNVDHKSQPSIPLENAGCVDWDPLQSFQPELVKAENPDRAFQTTLLDDSMCLYQSIDEDLGNLQCLDRCKGTHIDSINSMDTEKSPEDRKGVLPCYETSPLAEDKSNRKTGELQDNHNKQNCIGRGSSQSTPPYSFAVEASESFELASPCTMLEVKDPGCCDVSKSLDLRCYDQMLCRDRTESKDKGSVGSDSLGAEMGCSHNSPSGVLQRLKCSNHDAKPLIENFQLEGSLGTIDESAEERHATYQLEDEEKVLPNTSQAFKRSRCFNNHGSACNEEARGSDTAYTVCDHTPTEVIPNDIEPRDAYQFGTKNFANEKPLQETFIANDNDSNEVHKSQLDCLDPGEKFHSLKYNSESTNVAKVTEEGSCVDQCINGPSETESKCSFESERKTVSVQSECEKVNNRDPLLFTYNESRQDVSSSGLVTNRVPIKRGYSRRFKKIRTENSDFPRCIEGSIASCHDVDYEGDKDVHCREDISVMNSQKDMACSKSSVEEVSTVLSVETASERHGATDPLSPKRFNDITWKGTCALVPHVSSSSSIPSKRNSSNVVSLQSALHSCQQSNATYCKVDAENSLENEVRLIDNKEASLVHEEINKHIHQDAMRSLSDVSPVMSTSSEGHDDSLSGANKEVLLCDVGQSDTVSCRLKQNLDDQKTVFHQSEKPGKSGCVEKRLHHSHGGKNRLEKTMTSLKKREAHDYQKSSHQKHKISESIEIPPSKSHQVKRKATGGHQERVVRTGLPDKDRNLTLSKSSKDEAEKKRDNDTLMSFKDRLVLKKQGKTYKGETSDSERGLSDQKLLYKKLSSDSFKHSASHVKLGSGTGMSMFKNKKGLKLLTRDIAHKALMEAGFTIDLRPRSNKDYRDSVYVSPNGQTHWSVPKAWEALKKMQAEGSLYSDEKGCSQDVSHVADMRKKNANRAVNKEERKQHFSKADEKDLKKVFSLFGNDEWLRSALIKYGSQPSTSSEVASNATNLVDITNADLADFLVGHLGILKRVTNGKKTKEKKMKKSLSSLTPGQGKSVIVDGKKGIKRKAGDTSPLRKAEQKRLENKALIRKLENTSSMEVTKRRALNDRGWSRKTDSSCISETSEMEVRGLIRKPDRLETESRGMSKKQVGTSALDLPMEKASLFKSLGKNLDSTNAVNQKFLDQKYLKKKKEHTNLLKTDGSFSRRQDSSDVLGLSVGKIVDNKGLSKSFSTPSISKIKTLDDQCPIRKQDSPTLFGHKFQDGSLSARKVESVAATQRLQNKILDDRVSARKPATSSAQASSGQKTFDGRDSVRKMFESKSSVTEAPRHNSGKSNEDKKQETKSLKQMETESKTLILKQKTKKVEEERKTVDSKSTVCKVEKPKIRTGIRLEVRKMSSTGSEESICHSSRTINAWMIDRGAVLDRERIIFVDPTNQQVVKAGVFTREGILCSCCKSIFTAQMFQDHAGGQHDWHKSLIFMSGKRLLERQLKAWEAEIHLRKVHNYKGVSEDDPNDDSCLVCGDGGDLICCDSCPSTFHASCLELDNVPAGDWYCPKCSCNICGGHEDDGEEDSAFVLCSQCEHRFHIDCMHGPPIFNGKKVFCQPSCEEIFSSLRSMIGISHSLPGGFSWTLLRCMEEDNISEPAKRKFQIDCHSKLAVALLVIKECFNPMVDPRTNIDMITNAVYNRRSNFNRLNYAGFYTAVLEKEGEVISVASIRIHGVGLAEMPLIGTREKYRRQGMCRLLVGIIEKLLSSIHVSMLVLPAIAELFDTWTKAFGYRPIDLYLKSALKDVSMMVFPGTKLLQKSLRRRQESDDSLSQDSLGTS